MIDYTSDLLKKDLMQYMSDDFNRRNDRNATGPITLDENQKQTIIKKISVLPEKSLHLLLLYYVYNFDEQTINDLLSTTNSFKKINALKILLADLMCFEDKLIDDDDIKNACQHFLETTLQGDANIKNIHPHYSKHFWKKMRQHTSIKKPRKSWQRSNYQKVAIVFIACFISFSTMLIGNAQIRIQLYNWWIKNFSTHSIFKIETDSAIENEVNLKSFKVTYVPQGFSLKHTIHGKNMMIYEYTNKDEKVITITLQPVENNIYIDSEDAIIETIVFENNQAFLWHADDVNHLVFQKDNLQISISSLLNKKELIKIANKIIK